MKGKKMLLAVLLALALCSAASGVALAMSSANYNLLWTVLSGGGGGRTSSNYILSDTAGQSSATGISTSTNYWLGAGYWYEIAPPTTPPSTPVVIDDGFYTTNTAQLHAMWRATDGGSGIAEYQYTIRTPGATPLVLWTSAGTSIEVTTTGLTLIQGTTYYFAVKCRNNIGIWSDVGVSDGIRVDNTPPSIPVVIDDGAHTSSTTELHATWSATDAESGIVEYQYGIGTSPGATDVVNWTSAGTSIEVTATGLTLIPETTYYFAVKCLNGAGLWSDVGTSDGIAPTTKPPPNPPTDLIATAVSSNQIDLAWQDNSIHEIGFRIIRKIEKAGTYVYVLIATVGANITSYSDTNLTANTTYYYRVRAYGDGWDSAFSNEAQATTLAAGKAIITGNVKLQPAEYRPGPPAPGYSRTNWPIYESWMNVRMENKGTADAFNVKATITKVPTSVTIVDGQVSFGNILKGTSAWSADTFRIKTDTSKPQDPKEGIFWKIEYDDASGVHHVIENVPQFPTK